MLCSEIYAKTGQAIDRLQVKYGDVWASAHGGGSGGPVSCTFASRIIRVKLTTSTHMGGFVNGLEFVTHDGKSCGIGDWRWVGTAEAVTLDLHHPGYYLSFLSGGIGKWTPAIPVVNPLSFHWSPVKEEGTSRWFME